jgi:L-malate glycosyltransferase
MDRILYIGNKLAAKGYSPTSIDTLGPRLEKEGFNMQYAGTAINPLLRLVQMILLVLRQRKRAHLILIDTYSGLAFYYAIIISLLSRFLKIPYLPILRGGNFKKRMEQSPVLCRWYLSRSKNNIVISGFLQEALNDKGYKSSLIPNTLDIKDYSFLQRENAKPSILWVRAFHKIYQPWLAIDLVERLKDKFPCIKLTMVGPDKDGSLEQAKSIVSQKGLQDHVTFTGVLSKKAWHKLAEEHDVFINTTSIDNLPVSVMEAMALGLCVVSTNVGGVPWLVKDEENGLLVNPGDILAMEESVARILQAPQLSVRLSSKAREKALQFDWEIIKLQWKEILC